MSILKELVALHEAERVSRATVGLETLYGKAKHDLAKTAELIAYAEKNGACTWHGDRLVVTHERGYISSGPLEDKVIEAVRALINDNEYSAEVHQEIDAADFNRSASGKDDESDNETNPGYADFDWEAKFQDDEIRLVYLGYDPVKDKIYAGFDAWVSEEEFNDKFDGAFKEATGVEYDSDNEEHYAIFDKAWKEFQHEGYSMWGLIFEISHRGEDYHAEEEYPPMPHGFFQGTMKHFGSNIKNRFIDLV